MSNVSQWLVTLGQCLLALMERSSTLEYVNIKNIPDGPEYVNAYDDGVQQFQLPKLKTLQLPEIYCGGLPRDCFWESWLLFISDGAPNLQELKTTVSLRWAEHVPEEKLRIFKSIKLPRLWREDDACLDLNEQVLQVRTQDPHTTCLLAVVSC